MEEYEKTISQLVAEKEHEKQMFEQERAKLTKERDQALEDLSNVEVAFSDVHRYVVYLLHVAFFVLCVLRYPLLLFIHVRW